MTDAITAEEALPWTPHQIAEQIAAELERNYYQPQGEPPSVSYDPEEAQSGQQVLWVDVPGADRQIAVVVVAYEQDPGTDYAVDVEVRATT